MKLPLWIATLLVIVSAVGRGEPALERDGPVVIVKLDSNVSAAQFFLVRRALKTAERDGARAFVIEMNTFGGSLQAAFDHMDALLKTRVPTYTFVNDKAISAGALIAIATQKIYMAPTGVIGDAAPVLATGGDLPKTMTDKTVSAMSAMARNALQKHGHNPDLADSFIIKEKELKIGDVVVDKPDMLLTLSATEATRLFDGKPLLAVGIVGSVNELLEKEGLSRVPVQRIHPTGFERLALWITAIAPLLLLGGIVGGYIEFKMPGFGIFGLLSIVCFVLFFTGHYVAGLSGWEVFVLFALGVALVIGELVLHPGTILPGLLGILMILAALIYAMVDHWPSQPVWPSSAMLMRPLLNLSIAIAGALLVAFLLAKYLPRTSLYNQLVLAAEVPSGPAITTPAAALAVGLGATGIAQTPLRPSGKAVFGERLLDVVSRGEFIDSGASVRVVLVEGARVVVEVA